MYNRFHRDKNQRPMLNSFITAINASIFPKKHDENIFSGKLSINYMPGLIITLM